MFKFSCKCGKNEKAFKFNIGEEYYDVCCAKAGFEKGQVEPSNGEASESVLKAPPVVVEVDKTLTTLNPETEVKTDENEVKEEEKTDSVKEVFSFFGRGKKKDK